MEKIKELTSEQESKLNIYKEKWLNKIFNYELNKSITFESVKNKMIELYEFCNLKKPIVILVDSPMACQIAANILNNSQVMSQVENQVENQVWSQIRDKVSSRLWGQVWNQLISKVWNQIRIQGEDQVINQVGSQLESQLQSQVESQVESQVWSQVWDQVWDQVRNQVWFQVGFQVEDQVMSQVKNQVESINFFQFSTYINYSDFGWLSFYDYFYNENIIKDNLKDNLNKIISFTNHSFMQIQLDGVCIVSKYPSNIFRNLDNDLHNINGPAIQFEDGYSQHYFNGIFISPELFEKLINKSFNFKEWTEEKNEEIKSLILAFYEEKFGSEFVFDFLSKYLKEVDNYIDKKEEKYLKNTKGMNIGVYTLFKGKINNINIGYVRCYCPSTDRMFFLGVHPSINNAKDAIASLCQIPNKLKNNLLSISRQGEMFSFNFDETGTKMLKNKELTKEDYQNAASLKGDEYFSKIKFEY
jgi:hypothetical protein